MQTRLSEVACPFCSHFAVTLVMNRGSCSAHIVVVACSTPAKGPEGVRAGVEKVRHEAECIKVPVSTVCFCLAHIHVGGCSCLIEGLDDVQARVGGGKHGGA